MLTPVYALAAATQVPPLPEPAAQALIYPPDALPLLTRPRLFGGERMELADQFNILSADVQAQGRAGAGAYGVASGLDLQSDGTSLTLTVSPGTAMLDLPVVVKVAQTLPMTTGVYNWVWLSAAGTLSATTLGAQSPVPAAPSSPAVFLGRVDATSGVVGAIDYSGRPQLRGGVLWRQTGDLQAPGDTPPASLLFWARTLGGTYVWDGQGYSLVSAGQAAVAAVLFSSFENRVRAVEDQFDLLLTLLRQVIVWVGSIDNDIPPALQEEWELGLEDQGDVISPWQSK